MTTPQDPHGQPPEQTSPAFPGYPGSMPPPTGGFVRSGPVGPRPKEVDYSFWLWVTNFALGLVGLIFFVGEFDTIRDTALEEARRQGGAIDDAQLESITTTALIIAVIIGVLFSALQVLFAFFMRKGRNWARIVLAVFGGLSVLSGLYSLATASGGQLALSMISLLVVIGAVVTMFLAAANPWFRPRPGI
ncbi:MAG: hypothetical protein ACRDTE_01030 [Pseudonocardiaceae bacterium]